MTKFYLIRHGETIANAAQSFQGQQNSPLNETGILQAKDVAKRLSDVNFDAIYSSDLDRAVSTANEIRSENVFSGEIITDTRLREANFGEWEGNTYKDVMQKWPDIANAWLKDSYNTRPPGGETLDDVVKRVGEMLELIAADRPEDTVAIVCHGGPIRAAVCHILGVKANVFSKISVDNCSLTIVEISEGRNKLKKLNLTS